MGFDVDLSGGDLPPGVEAGSLGGEDPAPPNGSQELTDEEREMAERAESILDAEDPGGAEPPDEDPDNLPGEATPPTDPDDTEDDDDEPPQDGLGGTPPSEPAPPADGAPEVAESPGGEVPEATDLPGTPEPEVTDAPKDSPLAALTGDPPTPSATTPSKPKAAKKKAAPKKKTAPKKPKATADKPSSGSIDRLYYIFQLVPAEVEGQIIDVPVRRQFARGEGEEPLEGIVARNRDLALLRAAKVFGEGFDGTLVACPEGMWTPKRVHNKPKQVFSTEIS